MCILILSFPVYDYSNMEKEYILLDGFPLKHPISENVYMSQVDTKKYVVKYLKFDDHAFIKEIEFIKFLNQVPGPQIIFDQKDIVNSNNTNLCELICKMGCCTRDDAVDDNVVDDNKKLLTNQNKIKYFDSRYVYQYVTTIEKDNMRYLVTEYSGGDMFDFIANNNKSFTERTIKRIFYDLVCAIKGFHELGLAHGDISLENVCIQEEIDEHQENEIDRTFKIKVIDIAFAMVHPKSPYNEIYKKYEKYEYVKIYKTNNIREFPTGIHGHLMDEKNSYLGKVFYMSPERFEAQEYDVVYCSYKDDTYALGIILYSLIFGTIPYKKPSENNQNFKNIITGKWKKNLKEENYKQNHIAHKKHSGHQEVIDLIDKILKFESKRLTLIDILKHPWFNDIEEKFDFIYDTF